ncbi:farnesyl-diphosphate farnesyltransferase [Heliocybe sulcata]|uniref:Squalene synthase n=1 Tax=Heliocybe sulcata TaxID=5364 RepID=A0A5C3NCY9_9AGAM|nr:farnesyl-diphosphate farnesyltransferase [Heliocybe sulcata]
MTAMSMLALLLTHPLEFLTLAQFWLYHDKNRDISSPSEHATSGWDRQSMRRCWEFLDLSGRSFSAVVKELDGDLARTICLFYLVLRGLDTIEDDMTIPDDVKQPILRSFHEKTVTPGWTFKENGPDEKDRQLLVEYDVVAEELNRVAPDCRDVIVDICHKMEVGMADYAHKAASTSSLYLATVAEYDLYCQYVAGLVGEGLSRLFSASGKEADWLQYQLELSNSMGSLLQKTNIIRDYREDVEEGRFFWPREIWGREEYGGFKEMAEMYVPANQERALWVQSGMVVDALRHAQDSLDYLRLLKNQTVFNFCAIPATMAMATLELCFMNPDMFQRNIRIRKAEAARLIMRSTNPRGCAYMFRDYARKIHAKASPSDPNFLRLSVACGKIEQWCERHYPSFVNVVQAQGNASQLFDPLDTRTRIVQVEQKQAEELLSRKRRVDGKPVALETPAAT